MTPLFVLVNVYICMMVALAIYTFKEPLSNKRFVLKMTCSGLFLLIGICSTIHTQELLYGAILICALILAIMGDYFLGLKERSKDNYLKKGVMAFITCQLFYIAMLNINFRMPLFIPIICALSFGGIYFIKLPINFGNMKKILCLYSFVLSVMLLSCGHLYWLNSTNPYSLLVLIAGISFIISDIFLLLKYFIIPNNSYIMVINVFAYFVAQLLFALSPLLF